MLELLRQIFTRPSKDFHVDSVSERTLLVHNLMTAGKLSLDFSDDRPAPSAREMLLEQFMNHTDQSPQFVELLDRFQNDVNKVIIQRSAELKEEIDCMFMALACRLREQHKGKSLRTSQLKDVMMQAQQSVTERSLTGGFAGTSSFLNDCDQKAAVTEIRLPSGAVVRARDIPPLAVECPVPFASSEDLTCPTCRES